MTQTTTKTPADLLREMTVNLIGPVPTGNRSRDPVTLPTIHAETDGVTLTVRCGERTTTLALCDDHVMIGPVLLGPGGYVLPEFDVERWSILAAILPMREDATWTASGLTDFGLADMARNLGYRVVHSPLDLLVDWDHHLHLMRLEHPTKKEVWGSVTDVQGELLLRIGGAQIASYVLEKYPEGLCCLVRVRLG